MVRLRSAKTEFGTSDPRPQRAPSRWLMFVVVSVAFCGPFLWCFGPALFRDQSFAFRDAAHFYYSLFDWVSRQWASGRVPLWNPQENCGMPVLSDGTSSVFYPGKLLFALPLGHAWNFKLYTMLHVLLAAGASWRLARRWGATPYAAALAAVAYAFGGSVLFQYCNTVYLGGAAWLPLALGAADRMLVERSLRAAWLLAAVLAMMVLGGDPQMAYHAGLLAAAYGWLLWRDERRARREAAEAEPAVGGDGKMGKSTSLTLSTSRASGLTARFLSPRKQSAGLDPAATPRNAEPSRPARRRLTLLSASAIAAAGLAAIQVLPSSEWSRQSERAACRSPRSLYEIPGYLVRERVAGERSSIATGLFGVPDRGMHHEHIYDFSVGPWRLAELVWPNFSGQMFPIHRRRANAIPAEGRVWSPSLYLGLVPLLLGLGAWRLRGGPASMRWRSWASLLATLASFGGYGLGWLVHEFRCGVFGAAADDLVLAWPVGGLYWLLVVALPGYAYFRYPAKLLVIAALGLSQLAAFGLDRLGDVDPVRLRRCLLGVVVLSLTAYLATFAIGTVWSDWTRQVRPDALFGPFDASGSLVGLRAAFLHTVLLGALVLWLLGGSTRESMPWLAPALLLLTAPDIGISNGWMILTAPRSDWTETSRIADRIAEGEAHGESRDGGGPPVRVFRGSSRNWRPKQWSLRRSAERHRQALRWDRQTLYPKYHLDNGLAMVEAYGGTASYDYLAVLGAARRYGLRRPDGVAEPDPSLMNVLGVEYFMFPADFDYPAGNRLPLGAGRPPVPNVALWRNPQSFPRAWIVHEVVTVPPLHRAGPDQIARRTRQVFFPGDAPLDFRHTAVVESDVKPELPEAVEKSKGRKGKASDVELELPAAASPGVNPDQESCRIVSAEAQRVEVEVELKQAGLLVLSDLFYPGWTAEVTSADGRRTQPPILRTNRIMRGLVLSAGRHHVIFAYRPPLFYAGAAISAVAWLGLGLGCVLHARLSKVGSRC